MRKLNFRDSKLFPEIPQKCDIRPYLASSFSLCYVNDFYGRNDWVAPAWKIDEISRRKDEGQEGGVHGFQSLKVLDVKDKKQICNMHDWVYP